MTRSENTSFSTVTRFSVWPSRTLSRRWVSRPVGSRTAVLGKMPWRNPGLAAAAANYSNTLPSGSSTFGDFYLLTVYTK